MRHLFKKSNPHFLKGRRAPGDLTQLNKWMKGFSRSDANEVLAVKEQRRRRSNVLSWKKRDSTHTEKNRFISKVKNEWKMLGRDALSDKTMGNFKKRLNVC